MFSFKYSSPIVKEDSKSVPMSSPSLIVNADFFPSRIESALAHSEIELQLFWQHCCFDSPKWHNLE